MEADLVIEREREYYVAFCRPVRDQSPRCGGGPRPQTFPGENTLTGFLLKIIALPPDRIAQALQGTPVRLSPEQVRRWPSS